jgi:predicted nucleic acid-binding protein
MNAIDTNVLFYSRDPRDPRKQQIAVRLVGSLANGALLWQVACEYQSASRKLIPFGYSSTHAMTEILNLRKSWATVLPDWTAFDRADELRKSYSLSFWDAVFIAACLEGGVQTLYSEDFDAYSRIDSLELVNPFR